MFIPPPPPGYSGQWPPIITPDYKPPPSVFQEEKNEEERLIQILRRHPNKVSTKLALNRLRGKFERRRNSGSRATWYFYCRNDRLKRARIQKQQLIAAIQEESILCAALEAAEQCHLSPSQPPPHVQPTEKSRSLNTKGAKQKPAALLAERYMNNNLSDSRTCICPFSNIFPHQQ